jgi:hypothetical protein
MSTAFSVSTNVNTEAARKTIPQNAHGFTVGTPVRRTSGSYVVAQADSLGNSSCDGIVTGVPNADSFDLTSNGYASGLSGFTDGDQYYLSPSVAGTTTTTRTSTVGQFIKPLFKAISATEIIVLIGEGVEVEAAPAGGGGALEFIAQRNITVAQATIEFDNTEVTSTYTSYELHFREMREQAAAADSLILSLSANGGFDDNANYPGYMKTINSAGTEANVNMNASSGCLICPNIRTQNAVGAHGFGVVRLQNLTSSGNRPRLIDVSGTSNVLDGGFNIITQRYEGGAGRNAGLDPVDGIKLKMLNSATLTGVATLYGLKES